MAGKRKKIANLEFRKKKNGQWKFRYAGEDEFSSAIMATSTKVKRIFKSKFPVHRCEPKSNPVGSQIYQANSQGRNNMVAIDVY